MKDKHGVLMVPETVIDGIEHAIYYDEVVDMFYLITNEKIIATWSSEVFQLLGTEQYVPWTDRKADCLLRFEVYDTLDAFMRFYKVVNFYVEHWNK